MARKYRKYLLNFLFILLFAIVAIYFSIKDEYSEIVDLITNINQYSILIVFVIALIPFIIEGYILQLLSNIYKKDFNVKQGIQNAFIGGFISGITPLASGGQFAQVFHLAECGLSTTASINILLMDFLVYQSTLVVYTSIVLFFKYAEYVLRVSSIFSLAIIGFIINIVVIGILFLAAKSSRAQLFVTDTVLKIFSKLKLIKNYESQKLAFEQKVVQFRTELKTLLDNKKVLISTLLLMTLRLTISFCIPFLCLKLLDRTVDISIIDCICVTAFITLITAFIPIPGASGGSEGTYVLLYSSFVTKALASSSMLIWRFATYYFILVVGAVAFIWSKRKVKK